MKGLIIMIFKSMLILISFKPPKATSALNTHEVGSIIHKEKSFCCNVINLVCRLYQAK